MKLSPIFLVLVAIGCGPMTFPAVQRLDPEDQARVNSMWDNMLSPPGRLDRELLLDVLVASSLQESGVDHLKFQSEKEFAGGTVRMNITFNRIETPADDRFEITIQDRNGRQIRHETFSGEEVLSHLKRLFEMYQPVQVITPTISTTQPATLASAATAPATELDYNSSPASPQPQLTADQQAQIAWRQSRWQQIIAATQPATLPAGR